MKNKDKIEYISEEDTGAVDKKIKKIKKQLKACQKEKEEYLAGWQRAKADLINYKKEQEQKISDYYKFANQGLILEILMVLDSFEEALKHEKNEAIEQLYNQLKNILKNQGLEEIKAIGEKFNPEFHESVGEVKGKKPGLIVKEVQKGYKLNNKVIRPSRVKISK
jgi:molecular chaperone GrpE